MLRKEKEVTFFENEEEHETVIKQEVKRHE